MPIFPTFRWFRRRPAPTPQRTEHAAVADPKFPLPERRNTNAPKAPSTDVKRHFYNERNFQTYATFFPLWNGWATAAHVLTDSGDRWPDFMPADPGALSWPDGLDAALCGCDLPHQPPAPPRIGQDVIIRGYPAGSRHLEERRGTVYLERYAGGGVWIAHIKTPDEPVVSGMSGGPVIDADTGEPIGIVITRNSPADLNNDRDPDESCDFVALEAVWHAVMKNQAVA